MKWSKVSKKRSTGMTLIELLITVAIVVVLASWLYPSYQQHILKSYRIAAISDLAKLQIELERQYQGSYALIANSLLPDDRCLWCQTNQSQFAFLITATDSSYIIQAQPINSQMNDQCDGESYTFLSLNQAGEYTPIKCWQ